MAKGMSLLDWVMATEASLSGIITRKELGEAMLSKDKDRIDRAIKLMKDAGGYENLPQE